MGAARSPKQEVQDKVHQKPQPGEDEAKVVPDGGKDDIGGVAVTALGQRYFERIDQS